MKSGKKANKIYELLKKSILRRRLSPGMLLPGEKEFSAELGVSRDTFRKALAMLEAEHLVRRVRGHGTYVSESIPKRKITFLLPCSETIKADTYHIGNFLGGVQEACRRLMCELETLAISPTNNLNDIDWSQLFNLNKGSLVIVYGLWFQKIFPFLLATGCKVVLIHEQRAFYPKDLAKILSRPGWSDFLLDREGETEQMVRHAFEHGYRRPGFIMSYLDFPENIMPHAIRKVCGELYSGYVPPMVSIPDKLPKDEVRKVMEDVLEKHHCDCLFINTFYSMVAIREFFPHLDFGFFHRNSIRDFVGNERSFYSWQDSTEIAYQAVLQLLRNDDTPKQHVFQSSVSEYQSRPDGSG